MVPNFGTGHSQNVSSTTVVGMLLNSYWLSTAFLFFTFILFFSAVRTRTTQDKPTAQRRLSGIAYSSTSLYTICILLNLMEQNGYSTFLARSRNHQKPS